MHFPSTMSEEQKKKDRDDSSLWVNDGSVDLKGARILRERSGGWRASIFILGVEFCERLAYYTIVSTLMLYLTTVLNQGIAYSAKNVNYWSGFTTVLPLVGGFLADSYFGQFHMVLFASAIYLSGLILLTISASLPSLKPTCQDGECNKATSTQLGIFFMALYMVALGTSGHKPSLQAFGADQFDEGDKQEKLKKNSFFNWWYFGVCIGTVIAFSVVAYLLAIMGWGFGYGIPTIAMSLAVIIFLYGSPFYRHKMPRGSPLKKIAQVIVASLKNKKLELPIDSTSLYEETNLQPGQRQLFHTSKFKFLDKAAIIHGDVAGAHDSWKICSVTQVEETKLLLRLFPIWVSCLPFGITVAQGSTFFIKQAATMDRNLGPSFQIPTPSMLAFASIAGIIFIVIYDRLLVPMARRFTGNERGVTVLQRIGIGMMLSVVCMGIAAITEIKRVKTATDHGLLDNPKDTIPLSVFWLAPQFCLLGIADVFTLVGLQQYFYEEVPDSMRSLGIAFYLSVMGVSSFLSSFLISLIDLLSISISHHKWFMDNLNKSKIDGFYWIVAALGALNFCCFVYFAKVYQYKKAQQINNDSEA